MTLATTCWASFNYYATVGYHHGGVHGLRVRLLPCCYRGGMEISTEGVRGGLLLYRIMSLPVEEAFGSGALGGELQPLGRRRN